MKLLRTTLPTLHTRLASIDHQVRLLEHRDPEAKERQRLYATQAWRKLRTAQLRRQPWCQAVGCCERATVADHVLGHGDPLWRERFFNPRLLQSLCATCHSRKTSRTEQAGAGGPRRAGLLPPIGLPTNAQEMRTLGHAPAPLPERRSPRTRAAGHAGAPASGVDAPTGGECSSKGVALPTTRCPAA